MCLIWANNPPAPLTSPFTHSWGAIKNPVHLGVTSLFGSLLTFVNISVHHGWGAIINPKCPPYLSRAQPLFGSLLIFIGILFTLLGPMLLTLHACPIQAGQLI